MPNPVIVLKDSFNGLLEQIFNQHKEYESNRAPSIVKDFTKETDSAKAKGQIKNDIPRTVFLDTQETSQKQQKLWQSTNLQDTRGFKAYNQGNMDGGFFPGNIQALYAAQKIAAYEEKFEAFLKKNHLNIAYVDEFGIPCGVSVYFFEAQPALWIASIIRNTIAAPEEKEVLLIASKEMLPNTAEQDPSSLQDVSKALANFHQALRSIKISTLLQNIISEETGEINLKELETLKKCIHPQMEENEQKHLDLLVLKKLFSHLEQKQESIDQMLLTLGLKPKALKKEDLATMSLVLNKLRKEMDEVKRILAIKGPFTSEDKALLECLREKETMLTQMETRLLSAIEKVRDFKINESPAFTTYLFTGLAILGASALFATVLFFTGGLAAIPAAAILSAGGPVALIGVVTGVIAGLIALGYGAYQYIKKNAPQAASLPPKTLEEDIPPAGSNSSLSSLPSTTDTTDMPQKPDIYPPPLSPSTRSNENPPSSPFCSKVK